LRIRPRLRQALLTIALGVWPVAATGQIADLVPLFLPPPELGLCRHHSSRLPGPAPAGGGHDRRTWTLAYDRREPLTTRSSGNSALYLEQGRTVRVVWPVRRGAWRAGLAAAQRGEIIRGWGNDRSIGPRLDSREDRLDLEIWLGRDETWRLRGTLPVWRTDADSGSHSAGYDIAWSPWRQLGFTYKYGKLEMQPNFRTPVIDDGIDVCLNLLMQHRRYEARIGPLPWITLRLAHLAGEAKPATPLSRQQIDELQLTGELTGSWRSLAIEPLPGLELAYASSDWELEAEGGLYWGGQRYGRLNILLGELDADEGSVTWRGNGRYAVRLARSIRELSAFGRGRMESWPFTPTAIDLLGARQVAEGELTARLERWALSAETKAGFWNLGLGWARHTIRPEGTLDTWIPAFFGIGRTNFIHRELDVDRIVLNEVRLALRTVFAHAELSLDIRQFVSATVKQPKDEPAPAPEEPSTPSPPDQGWWGGLFLSTAVTVPF